MYVRLDKGKSQESWESQRKLQEFQNFIREKKFSYHIKVMKFNERNEMKYIFFHVRNEIK